MRGPDIFVMFFINYIATFKYITAMEGLLLHPVLPHVQPLDLLQGQHQGRRGPQQPQVAKASEQVEARQGSCPGGEDQVGPRQRGRPGPVWTIALGS